MNMHERRVEAICARSTGLVSLSQVCAIPDGFQKNRSQIWHLTVKRSRLLNSLDLVTFDHRSGIGVYGSGSIRTKSFILPCNGGRDFLKLCQQAAREANLAMPPFYKEYLTYPREFAERRDRFRSALLALYPEKATT